MDPEQFRVQSIIDRIDVMGKAFLGLTVNCCQCHNHKYDPISQKEYYQFFAFLNNDDEPELEVPNQYEEPERDAIRNKIAAIEDDTMAKTSDLPKKMAAWEEKMKALPRDWIVLDPVTYYGSVGTKFNKLEHHSLLAAGSVPPISAYTIIAKTDLTNITGFRLEALSDPNLPASGPGRAANGNFVLTQFSVAAAPISDHTKTSPVPLQNATADFSQAGFPVTAAIDGKSDKKTGWAAEDLPGRRNLDRRAVFEAKSPVGFKGGTYLTFTLDQTSTAANTPSAASASPHHGGASVARRPVERQGAEGSFDTGRAAHSRAGEGIVQLLSPERH